MLATGEDMPTPIERTEALILATAMLHSLSTHSHISKAVRRTIVEIGKNLPTLEELEKPNGLFQRIEPWVGGPLDMQPKGEGTIVHVWPPQYVWDRVVEQQFSQNRQHVLNRLLCKG